MLFPLVFADNYKSFARFDVVMRDKVNKSNLQTALDNLLLRFPTFFVALRHDKRNFFFETLSTAPKIVEGKQPPFSMTFDDLYDCAFKIEINRNNLALEFFHSISDAFGASIFLRTLLAEYVKIEYGVSSVYDKYTLNPLEQSSPDETSDDLIKNVTTKTKTKALTAAYRIKGKTSPNLNVNTLTYSCSELLICARKHGVTLTTLLSVVLGRALSEIKAHEKANNKEIKLSIPVDLRRRFNSVTLRNFSIPTTITIERRMESQSCIDLCRLLDQQIKINLDPESLKQMVTKYVKLASNKTLAKMPLSIKKRGVRAFYALFKNTTTMTLTNLGIFSVPDELEPYIQNLSVMISPKPGYPCTCAIVSFGDILTMTLTSSLEDDLLEKLIKKGIDDLLNIKYNGGTVL